MKLSEAVVLSSSNIRRHKLRSALTATGVAVGITTVIAMMTLGSSFEAYFVDQYNVAFAMNAFTIQPRTDDTATQLATANTALYVFPTPMFSQRDVLQLRNLTGVEAVAPYSTTWLGSNVKIDGKPLNTTYGVTAMAIVPRIFINGFLNLAAGNVANTSAKAVVGSAIAQSIAYEVGATNKTSYAIGHKLTFDYEGSSKTVTIVGVLKEAPLEGSLNTVVYLDLDPGETPTTTPAYNGLVVISDSPQQVASTESTTLAYLNSNSDGLKTLRSTGQGLNFAASAASGATSFLDQQVREYTRIILAMGIVALSGGAVAVSNIMLVSVTERTKEIGTIKALGGSKKDVVQMFLIEAVLVSLIGIVLGLGGGAVLGYALTRLPILGSQLPLVYDFAWFPISVGIGLVTGLAAGVYPAFKAAKLLPVIALKYE